jgi:hypothetical protein
MGTVRLVSLLLLLLFGLFGALLFGVLRHIAVL